MRRILRGTWGFLTRPRGRRPLGLRPPVAGPSWAPGRRARRDQRGVALMVVLAGIMVMTVLVTDMNYGARVRLLLAAHQKDEAQAYWLARTGVNIYRLILVANAQLKNSMGDIGSTIGINMGDALWQAIPFVSTGLMRMVFVTGGDADDLEEGALEEVARTGTVSQEIAEESRAQAGRFDDRSFLDFDGDFSASIVDEDSRINVNGFGSRTSSSVLQEEATALSLYGIMSGQEADQWFYDRNLDRWELIGNLADWVDTDNTRCGTQGGYEDDLYNRLDDPYLARNAPFGTKEEIRLVDGWQGEVYDKFSDRITVWGSGKVNINSASREVLFGLLKAWISPQPSDDFVNQLLDLMDDYKAFASFQSEQEFVDYLKNQGAEVSDGMKNVISTSSTVFTVTSTGVVGDTTVTITAVLDYSSSQLGTVRYWRVD